MNLPIIQSIMFGALIPNVVIVKQNINGRWVEAPADLSRIDYDGDPDDISMITKYESFEVDPDDLVSFPQLRTRYLLNYPALSRAFSTLPNTLSDLEKLCIKNLSPYIVFDFESERPINISKVVSSEYTPVPVYHFPVVFQLVNYIPQHPFAKFYVNVIRAEMERIKLALLDFAQNSQSDIRTKNEVENTLALMRYYASEAVGKRGESIWLSFEQLHRVDESELNQRSYEFNIFPLLQQFLIQTYIEIEILFQPLLKKNIEQDFDDLMFKYFKQYPQEPLKARLQSAMLLHQAQHYIKENDINALVSLHPEFVRLYPSNADNAAFMEVFKAVENAIFLGDNTDILQLIDDKFFKAQYREKWMPMQEEIIALSNPREIQPILENELDQLDLFADNIPLQSIPRRWRSWLTDRLESTKQNLGSIFIPTSKDSASQSSAKTPISQTSLKKQLKVAQTHLNFLTGHNLQNEKIMSDEDYSLLLQYMTSFLTDKTVPVITNRIRTNISQDYLRFTFYRIYKDLHLKQPSRNEWVTLLHSIFPQFDDTDESVTYKKLSIKPNQYDTNIMRNSQTISE